MTFTEFLAEIESSLYSFAEDGSINRISVKMNVIQELKKFGLNITEVKEKVLSVENSMTMLPNDFKALKLALKTDPIGCKIEGDRDNVTDSYIYRQRIENPAYFDEVNQEYITSCKAKIITERITINDTPVDFYYNPQWLSVVKGVKKAGFSEDCLNLHPSIRSRYPHEISISGKVINTNFSKGEIYVQYYAIPTDDDGDIIIPDMTTGDLFRYLETYCKAKIAEDLIANNANPQGLGQLYSMWKQELPSLKRAALVESKFYGLDKNWGKKFKKLNQRDIAVFNLPNLKF